MRLVITASLLTIYNYFFLRFIHVLLCKQIISCWVNKMQHNIKEFQFQASFFSTNISYANTLFQELWSHRPGDWRTWRSFQLFPKVWICDWKMKKVMPKTAALTNIQFAKRWELYFIYNIFVSRKKQSNPWACKMYFWETFSNLWKPKL